MTVLNPIFLVAFIYRWMYSHLSLHEFYAMAFKSKSSDRVFCLKNGKYMMVVFFISHFECSCMWDWTALRSYIPVHVYKLTWLYQYEQLTSNSVELLSLDRHWGIFTITLIMYIPSSSKCMYMHVNAWVPCT